MTKKLDVLLVENRTHAGEFAAATLRAAGHRVHHCYDPEARGFPCRGVTNPGDCPLDGGIDVALVVRHGVAPRAMPLEQGISCAIRAGVPVVEDGREALDPFEPWLTGRVDGDPVEACERAVETSNQPLINEVMTRISKLLDSAGIAAERVRCVAEPAGRNLRVSLDLGEPVDKRLEQAISVRVLDAVRSGRRTYGQVDVTVTGEVN